MRPHRYPQAADRHRRGIRNAGILDKVVAQLKDGAQFVIFDQTPPNPNETAVRAAVKMFRDGACDGIIAVGGGSSIDLAKGVAVCGTHEGTLKSFALIRRRPRQHHRQDGARHRIPDARAAPAAKRRPRPS